MIAGAPYFFPYLSRQRWRRGDLPSLSVRAHGRVAARRRAGPRAGFRITRRASRISATPILRPRATQHERGELARRRVDIGLEVLPSTLDENDAALLARSFFIIPRAACCRKLLARARRFNAILLGGGGVPFAALAQREGVSRSYFTRVVCLSYFAPDITQAILDGRQPRDLRDHIDFIRVIFHPICCHRSETVLYRHGVDICPPAPAAIALQTCSIGRVQRTRTLDPLIKRQLRNEQNQWRFTQFVLCSSL
jgi:hypothetical protein